MKHSNQHCWGRSTWAWFQAWDLEEDDITSVMSLEEDVIQSTSTTKVLETEPENKLKEHRFWFKLFNR